MDQERGTPGSNLPEDIEERDHVDSVTPEQYPASDREGSRVDQPGDNEGEAR